MRLEMFWEKRGFLYKHFRTRWVKICFFFFLKTVVSHSATTDVRTARGRTYLSVRSDPDFKGSYIPDTNGSSESSDSHRENRSFALVKLSVEAVVVVVIQHRDNVRGKLYALRQNVTGKWSESEHIRVLKMSFPETPRLATTRRRRSPARRWSRETQPRPTLNRFLIIFTDDRGAVLWDGSRRTITIVK